MCMVCGHAPNPVPLPATTFRLVAPPQNGTTFRPYAGPSPGPIVHTRRRSSRWLDWIALAFAFACPCLGIALSITAVNVAKRERRSAALAYGSLIIAIAWIVISVWAAATNR